MKKLITFFYLIFITVSGVAQADYADRKKDERKLATTVDKVNASLSMGAGIGISNSKFSNTAVTTYISPTIGYQFTQKFKLNVGLIHYNVSGNSFINRNLDARRFENGNRPKNGNIIQLQGQYLLNEKTTISGSVLYNANTHSSIQNNYKGATLGIDYKITPHATFSIQTTVIQGNGCNFPPYINYPFGQNQLIPNGVRPTLFNTSPLNF